MYYKIVKMPNFAEDISLKTEFLTFGAKKP